MTLKLGYARVSTDRAEGANEQTIGQQIDKLTEYGVKTSDIYSEKISGSVNLEVGTEWLSLKKRALEATEPVEIVMVDWSRLSRDGLAFQNAVATLSKFGCVFSIVGDSRYQEYAPKDSMDSMLLAFEAFGAQMYRERIQKATKAKLDYLKSQGVKLGRPSKLTDADRLVIEQLYAGGYGAGRIADELTKRRTAAIPLEVKAVEANYVRAIKHARISKATVVPVLRELVNDNTESN